MELCLLSQATAGLQAYSGSQLRDAGPSYPVLSLMQIANISRTSIFLHDLLSPKHPCSYQSTAISMATKPHSIRAVLYTLGLLGTAGTWGRAAMDGTLVHLFYALHGADEYILPRTKVALRKGFTGIYWPIDYLLDVLVIFFWEAVDGSHPATSAIGIYFLGQLFPILVAFYVNSFRAAKGSGASLIRFVLFLKGINYSFLQHNRPTLWLLSFQMCSLGCAGFAWALAYTASSQTTSRSLSSSRLRTASLAPPQMTLLMLPALVFGYVVPGIAMALPSPGIVTHNSKQLAVAFWNLYPLLVLLILKSLGAITPIFPSRWNYQSTTSPRAHLQAVRLVNCVSLVMSSTVHIGVSAISISTVLFSTLFHAKHAKDLSPGSITLPPLSITQGTTVGDGVRSFFLWDQAVGYPVMILVMMLELRTAAVAQGLPISWAKLFGIAVLTSFIAGPGSACLVLSWLRDEMLFGYGEDSGAKHKTR